MSVRAIIHKAYIYKHLIKSLEVKAELNTTCSYLTVARYMGDRYVRLDNLPRVKTRYIGSPNESYDIARNPMKQTMLLVAQG